MICPSCRHEDCVRSRRRGIADTVLAIAAVRPFRCMTCRNRFYARTVALAFLWHAHCPRCGNLELQQIAKQWVGEGKLRWIFRAFNAHAYRCDPCRHRFFSLRPNYELHRAAQADIRKAS